MWKALHRLRGGGANHRRRAQGCGVDVCAQWRADPLSHPDLREMTLRELADLPLAPACEAGCREERG